MHRGILDSAQYRRGTSPCSGLRLPLRVPGGLGLTRQLVHRLWGSRGVLRGHGRAVDGSLRGAVHIRCRPLRLIAEVERAVLRRGVREVIVGLHSREGTVGTGDGRDLGEGVLDVKLVIEIVVHGERIQHLRTFQRRRRVLSDLRSGPRHDVVAGRRRSQSSVGRLPGVARRLRRRLALRHCAGAAASLCVLALLGVRREVAKFGVHLRRELMAHTPKPEFSTSAFLPLSADMQLEFEPWLLLITLSAAAGLTLGALAARGRSKAWPLAARCLPSSIIPHENKLRDAALGAALLCPRSCSRSRCSTPASDSSAGSACSAPPRPCT